jgi:hypothetical protein
LPAERLRAAKGAAVTDQVHVELVGVLRIDQRQDLVVSLLE